jgi:hypothetical protein
MTAAALTVRDPRPDDCHRVFAWKLTEQLVPYRWSP